MYRFKRNYYEITGVILGILWLVLIISTLLDFAELGNGIIEVENILPLIKRTIIMGGIMIAIDVLKPIFIPRDYDYSVEVKEDIIIFCYSEGDKRVMQRIFTCTKTRKYFVLYDGNAVITVPYSKDILKFLEEVKK